MAVNTKLSSIPLINSPAQLQQQMQVWRQALSRTVKVASPPPAPLNFRATNAKGGILLQWSPIVPNLPTPVRILGEATTATGPDGYEILASASGDFVSDVQVYSLNDVTQTQFFVPTTGKTKLSFRMHSTAGNPYTPQSTFGADTATVTHTSIDTTDSTTKPTTIRDTGTSDRTRAASNQGRYANQYLNKTYGARTL